MKLDYRAMVDKKALTVADKLDIKTAYRETFSREMNLKNEKCRDCYNDALIELYNHSTPIRTIYFNGRWLTTTKK